MERIIACVTGASRGIGRAIAISLAREGYDLYLVCRSREKELLQLKDELQTACHVSCHASLCDVGDPAQVDTLFSQIREQAGRLDVLINNAAVSWRGLLTDMSCADWDALIRTNLNSVFYTSRLAVPLMLRRHAGKILNISSVWGCVGASCEVAYSASKGGVNAFTRALAKELAPSGIQVNAIACGVIDTEMNGFLEETERAALAEEIPAGRFGTPEEAAALAVSLCTGNDYLTGQIIKLDGAWI